jgi:hypothetical protein
MENNGGYKATLTISSDANDDGPYQLNMEFDPPYADVIKDLGTAPVSYQFMSKIMDEVILPVMVLNERYEAEFGPDYSDGSDAEGFPGGDARMSGNDTLN